MGCGHCGVLLFYTQLEVRGHQVVEERRKRHMEEPGDRPINNCTIFLGFTSNLISSGVREVLRYLVQNDMVNSVLALVSLHFCLSLLSLLPSPLLFLFRPPSLNLTLLSILLPSPPPSLPPSPPPSLPPPPPPSPLPPSLLGGRSSNYSWRSGGRFHQVSVGHLPWRFFSQGQ